MKLKNTGRSISLQTCIYATELQNIEVSYAVIETIIRARIKFKDISFH